MRLGNPIGNDLPVGEPSTQLSYSHMCDVSQKVA